MTSPVWFGGECKRFQEWWGRRRLGGGGSRSLCRGCRGWWALARGGRRGRTPRPVSARGRRFAGSAAPGTPTSVGLALLFAPWRPFAGRRRARDSARLNLTPPRERPLASAAAPGCRLNEPHPALIRKRGRSPGPPPQRASPRPIRRRGRPSGPPPQRASPRPIRRRGRPSGPPPQRASLHPHPASAAVRPARCLTAPHPASAHSQTRSTRPPLQRTSLCSAPQAAVRPATQRPPTQRASLWPPQAAVRPAAPGPPPQWAWLCPSPREHPSRKPRRTRSADSAPHSTLTPKRGTLAVSGHAGARARDHLGRGHWCVA